MKNKLTDLHASSVVSHPASRQPDLIENAYKAVLQKSIPAQICQLIRHTSESSCILRPANHSYFEMPMSCQLIVYYYELKY